jgi:hypothetical protein
MEWRTSEWSGGVAGGKSEKSCRGVSVMPRDLFRPRSRLHGNIEFG